MKKPVLLTRLCFTATKQKTFERMSLWGLGIAAPGNTEDRTGKSEVAETD